MLFYCFTLGFSCALIPWVCVDKAMSLGAAGSLQEVARVSQGMSLRVREEPMSQQARGQVLEGRSFT